MSDFESFLVFICLESIIIFVYALIAKMLED